MKKLIAMIMALCMVASLFVACGNDTPSTSLDGGNTDTTGSGSTDTTSSGDIEVDENLLTVEITLPASFFESDEDFDADTYAQEQGFSSAKVNDDGSVTVTMTKGKYKEMLQEMSDSLDESFAELVGAEDTPYIKEITHNDDFSSVTVKVDREAYENAFDMTPFVIGLSTMFYQAFLEMEYRCEISIVDAATGSVINTTVYPDVFEE